MGNPKASSAAFKKQHAAKDTVTLGTLRDQDDTLNVPAFDDITKINREEFLGISAAEAAASKSSQKKGQKKAKSDANGKQQQIGQNLGLQVNLEEKIEDPRIQMLQKRLKALNKRRYKLEKLAEQANGPDADKLNSDQLASLQGKDAVEHQITDYEELYKLVRDHVKLEQSEQKKKEKEVKQQLEDEKRAAQNKGRKEGAEVVQIICEFLRFAGTNRERPTPDADINDAVEKLLVSLYQAPLNAIEIAMLLHDADEANTIEGTAVSYKAIHDTVKDHMESVRASEEASKFAQEEELAQGAQHVDVRADLQHGIPQASRNEVFGINFLNKSEIEEADGDEDDSAVEPLNPMMREMNIAGGPEWRNAPHGTALAAEMYTDGIPMHGVPIEVRPPWQQKPFSATPDAQRQFISFAQPGQETVPHIRPPVDQRLSAQQIHFMQQQQHQHQRPQMPARMHYPPQEAGVPTGPSAGVSRIKQEPSHGYAAGQQGHSRRHDQQVRQNPRTVAQPDAEGFIQQQPRMRRENRNQISGRGNVSGPRGRVRGRGNGRGARLPRGRGEPRDGSGPAQAPVAAQ